MTKQHFIKIAEILNKHKNTLDNNLVVDLIKYFTKINSNFDQDKFIKAILK